jgi:CubicO group peptidase (beta-lactamase class C family)
MPLPNGATSSRSRAVIGPARSRPRTPPVYAFAAPCAATQRKLGRRTGVRSSLLRSAPARALALVPCIAAFVAVSLTTVAASTPAAGSSRDSLETYLRDSFAAQKIPGAAMAVIEDGRVSWVRSFGVTRVKAGEPVQPATLFRLGSTTKVFVAAAALTLVEEGRLDLHRPIGEYVPELPSAVRRLTLHQLLTHTAGLYDDAPMRGPADEAELGRMVRSWSDAAVFLEPGRFFSYSNPGYWLIGHLIESVDGRPFADAVRARVLAPLGMRRSTFRPAEAARQHLAAPHDGKRVEIRPAPNHAGTWPSGSLYSSAADMARFLTALVNDGVVDGHQALSRTVVRALLRSRVDVIEPRGHRYGYGLVQRRAAGDSIYFHSGTRMGYGSYLLIVPSRRYASVTLTNRSSTMLSSWHREAARRLLALDIAPEPADSPSRTLLEREFEPILGVYENPPGLSYELYEFKIVPWTREGGQLFSKRGPIRMPVYEVGPERFADENITFSLTRDGAGRPRWLHGEFKTLVRMPRGSRAASPYATTEARARR